MEESFVSGVEGVGAGSVTGEAKRMIVVVKEKTISLILSKLLD